MAGYHPPHRTPPRPERLRRIEPGFAFIPNRFLHQGFFASLSHAERSLYLFLVIAGDRNGVSFYAYDRICSTLEITPGDYLPCETASSTRTSSPSTARASKCFRCRKHRSPCRRATESSY